MEQRSRRSNRAELIFESYLEQQTKTWPSEGKHILAQFDDESIVVYQAYCPGIAKWAVEHQSFQGCPQFSDTRMTWIKTNFLWMMFRSGWGTKPNQERTLAIWLKREAFDRYLMECISSKKQLKPDQRYDEKIRLQWDPDHHPSGAKHPGRRAIQLGLKGVHTFSNGEDIVQIQDISDFVDSQYLNGKMNIDTLICPRERSYTPMSEDAAKHIQLGEKDPKHPRSTDATNAEHPSVLQILSDLKNEEGDEST
eukprot:TRINITY_DN21476_c0_g1_i1.p1 TRINITY_DN21476_c0_g1~~TRINITY_DN21476_c0_g1_i1.p1  ORF type:complete len:252 (+),score=55.78 TRINITY_DN21476_c0_g1_i1:35-790(+)